jgi:hypothetical protein
MVGFFGRGDQRKSARRLQKRAFELLLRALIKAQAGNAVLA